MTTELSPPKGHGIVRVSHNLRVHANRPEDWGSMAATDYWASWGDLTRIPGNAIGDPDLHGWDTTGYSHLAGSGADFLSSSDVGTTGGLNFDTAGDYIASPFIFGDFAHALMAGQILGFMPTRLNMECYARFGADGGDDEDTGFGFIEAGAATPFVKAGLMALITSDGTNFSLESGAAAAAGSADNQDAHQWKISFTSSGIDWFIDGTKQSNSLALQTDLFPIAWGASVGAGGTGDPVIAWTHIWYE